MLGKPVGITPFLSSWGTPLLVFMVGPCLLPVMSNPEPGGSGLLGWCGDLGGLATQIKRRIRARDLIVKEVSG